MGSTQRSKMEMSMRSAGGDGNDLNKELKMQEIQIADL
jgi:hypothetical protein